MNEAITASWMFVFVFFCLVFIGTADQRYRIIILKIHTFANENKEIDQLEKNQTKGEIGEEVYMYSVQLK